MSATVTSSETRLGTPVVPGIGVGPVVRPSPGPDPADVPATSSAPPEAEQGRYDQAVAVVADRLRERQQVASGPAAEVLSAQVDLVTDRGLTKGVRKQIAAGSSAEAATIAAVDNFAAMLAGAGGIVAERATDLRDLGGRVVAELLGRPEPGMPTPDEPSILLAVDLAPVDTAGLDPARILALVTSLGGATSHTAIIARQLGIPCVVAADVDDIEAGTVVLVDGGAGKIVIRPEADQAAELVARDNLERKAAATYAGPGTTVDGLAVAVLANVQDAASARKAADGPSEGVGLFRTELAFLGRDAEPTVDEQAEIYQQVFAAFAGRKVVVRTLDAGSDKPMAFASVPDEHNPALGVRGVRLSWANRGLMTRQLDAIVRAGEATQSKPWVMAPMVSTAAEARDFAEQVRTRGLTAGVMIEVPGAALLADRMLEHVDFLSIGTNDLAQYTMAADRLSGELAHLADFWQPAVVSLVATAARAGAAVDKPVGVCGEAAADPLMACVLVGLGISSLSMAASAVGSVGARLARVTREQCRASAAAVLAADDPATARAAAAEALAG